MPRQSATRHSHDISGVILAGGLSRRMGGGDKALRMLGGKTMLAHVIERLAPQAARLVLNANGDPARFAAYGLPVAPDPIEGFAGPLAGVLAGMRWSLTHAPGCAWVVSAAADTPFFPTDLTERFLAAAGGVCDRVVLAGSGGEVHPVFGLWPVALADDLEQAVIGGVRKVLDWTDRHDRVTVEFPFMDTGDTKIDPFFNANRPDDWEQAQLFLAKMRR